MSVAYPLGRDQPLVGVRGRHPDVDNRDIRVGGAEPAHELVAVGELAGDFEPRFGEQAREAFAHQHGVVGDDYAHGIRASIRTSPFDPASASISPSSARMRSPISTRRSPASSSGPARLTATISRPSARPTSMLAGASSPRSRTISAAVK